MSAGGFFQMMSQLVIILSVVTMGLGFLYMFISAKDSEE
jgi:hypothetical protein